MNSHADSISIITPVLNGIVFIEACIRNVIDQHCYGIEHVIIDGNSNDKTVEVIRQYAERYPHIRWISEEDRGQSNALNKGIAMARGEIMGILNVDDYYEPGVLDRVKEIFITLPEPSLVVGNCNVWDNAGQLILVNRPKKLTLADLLLGPDINPMPLNPSAYFYHKSIHQRIGPYDVQEDYILDWDFLLRAVQAATVKYVDEVWGNFRMLSNTKTYQDMQLDQSSHRQVQILRKYRSALPLLTRLQVISQYFLWHNLLGTVRYFYHKPEELPLRLKARLTRFLGFAKEISVSDVDKVD